MRTHTCALRVIKLIALTTASTGSQPETVSLRVGVRVGAGVELGLLRQQDVDVVEQLHR